jgi:hypothetical protein
MWLDCAFAETAADGADGDATCCLAAVISGAVAAHGGVLVSPGVWHEGFTFKLPFCGGVYRYQTGGTEITGRPRSPPPCRAGVSSPTA